MDKYNSVNELVYCTLKISNKSNLKELIDNAIEIFLLKKKVKLTILALNNAISKAVLLSEIIKSRIKNIHQICCIGCINNNNKKLDKDHYIKNNINDKQTIEIIIPKIKITLSNFSPNNIKNLKGYQPPYSIAKQYKLNTNKIFNDEFSKKSNIDRSLRYNTFILRKKKLYFNKQFIRKKIYNII